MGPAARRRRPAHASPPDEALLSRLPERHREKGVAYPSGNWASPVGRFRDRTEPESAAATARDHLDPLGVDRAVVTAPLPVLRDDADSDVEEYGTALRGDEPPVESYDVSVEDAVVVLYV